MTRRISLAFAIVWSLAYVGAAHADIVLYGSSYYSNSAFAVNSDGTTSVFATPIPGASGIVVSTSGDVYVASETNNSILRFSSTGASLGTFATDHINTPVGMAFDSSGNLYVANNAPGTISEYSAAGTYIKTFASGLSYPEGLVIDGSGNVFVSGGGAGGTITKFDPTGAISNTITTGLSYPGQLTFDSAGNLYASNAGGDTITKFNGLGAYQGVFATGTGSNDYGLVYDASTNSFYQGTFGPAANINGPIQHFDANGNSLGYVATDQPTAYFLAVRPRAVPEPASLAMLGIGAIGVMCYVRRRRVSADRA